MCGRMTPQQKNIARDRVVLDTRKLMEVLTWFIRDSGHKGFENTTPPDECPVPSFIEEPNTTHNTDDEIDPNVENRFAGRTFISRVLMIPKKTQESMEQPRTLFMRNSANVHATTSCPRRRLCKFERDQA
jgi:hypothetical protein